MNTVWRCYLPACVISGIKKNEPIFLVIAKHGRKDLRANFRRMTRLSVSRRLSEWQTAKEGFEDLRSQSSKVKRRNFHRESV
jgi:hypothetical protein